MVRGVPRPPSLISHPPMVSDSSAERLMWDMLSRDYVDVSFDRASANTRHVLNPSSDASRSLSTTSHPSMQSYTAAEVILSEEMGLIDTNYSEPADVGVNEIPKFIFHFKNSPRAMSEAYSGVWLQYPGTGSP